MPVMILMSGNWRARYQQVELASKAITIPSDLATYGKDAKSLLKELQSQNERMFMVTFLVLNTCLLYTSQVQAGFQPSHAAVSQRTPAGFYAGGHQIGRAHV